MIRLTKQSDYGIVLMTHLAAEELAAVEGDAPSASAPELALRLRIPQAMVAKILKQLARADLLVSRRGVRGGYSLAQPAAAISVAAIIRALDGPIALTDCSDENHVLAGHDCARESFCSVRANWQAINRAVESAFEGISLAEMTRPLPPESTDLVALGARRAAVRG